MDCYVYKGADVIGYFEDSKGRTQVLTTEGIYEDCEVGKNKKWIKENLKHFSKEQLKNYINNNYNKIFIKNKGGRFSAFLILILPSSF